MSSESMRWLILIPSFNTTKITLEGRSFLKSVKYQLLSRHNSNHNLIGWAKLLAALQVSAMTEMSLAYPNQTTNWLSLTWGSSKTSTSKTIMMAVLSRRSKMRWMIGLCSPEMTTLSCLAQGPPFQKWDPRICPLTKRLSQKPSRVKKESCLKRKIRKWSYQRYCRTAASCVKLWKRRHHMWSISIRHKRNLRKNWNWLIWI